MVDPAWQREHHTGIFPEDCSQSKISSGKTGKMKKSAISQDGGRDLDSKESLFMPIAEHLRLQNLSKNVKAFQNAVHSHLS